MSQKFVKDNAILWLQVVLRGTPVPWVPGNNYHIGDTVVPAVPVPALAGFMFQCVGFIGQSAGSQPTFPLTPGLQVVDGSLLWACRDPAVDPVQLPENEYYLIDTATTVVAP